MAHPRTAERGVSILEVTIVLLAISILTGAIAPAAKRSIDLARLDRAVSDEAAIKTAVVNFLTENATFTTGFTINGVAAGTPPDTLVSDGDIPSKCNPTEGCTNAPLWTNVVDNTGGLTDFLERHLVTNNPRGSAANDYPVGVAAWRGAYLNAPINPDPWGNRYAVNTRWLGTNSACVTRSNDVFVLSAGPDEAIDTPHRFDIRDDTGVVSCLAGTTGTRAAYPGADDLITIIRRDTGATTP